VRHSTDPSQFARLRDIAEWFRGAYTYRALVINGRAAMFVGLPDVAQSWSPSTSSETARAVVRPQLSRTTSTRSACSASATTGLRTVPSPTAVGGRHRIWIPLWRTFGVNIAAVTAGGYPEEFLNATALYSMP